MALYIENVVLRCWALKKVSQNMVLFFGGSAIHAITVSLFRNSNLEREVGQICERC